MSRDPQMIDACLQELQHAVLAEAPVGLATKGVPEATPFERQDSMVCRASSFADTTIDHKVAASVSGANASAWAMSSTGPVPDSSQPKRKQLPQGGLNRSGTLDRGMDALAATDLSVEPECREAHAKRQKAMSEPKDKDKLPVLTKAERARYVDFWQSFKFKCAAQEPAEMPSCKASAQLHLRKEHTYDGYVLYINCCRYPL